MKQPAESLNVTLVQAPLHWENKTSNLQMFEDKIAAVKEKMEIVILPEMFNTGFSMKPELYGETMEGETVAWMKRIAAERKIILTGSAMIGEEGKFYNRLIWMLPNGEYWHYDKRHLFAYAEEDKHFAGGVKRLITSVKGWKINVQVCYDLRFPLWARQSLPLKMIPDQVSSEYPGAEYDVLVYVANWPERRIHAWKTLLQARAIENQCYVVGVNRIGDDGNDIHYSGDSMVVDALGDVVFSAGSAEGSFTCALPLDKLLEVRTKLPFLKDADPFLIGT